MTFSGKKCIIEKVKILFSIFLISKNKFLNLIRNPKKQEMRQFRRWCRNKIQLKGGGKNIRKIIIQFIIILFITIIVISANFLIKDILEYQRSNNSNIKLIKQVVTKENNKEKTEIDWEKLEEINKEIIGWIKIENTNIDYPILKDNGDLKYLKHSFDGKYNINGSIFTLNDNPFQDNETIIHGHNMKNGIMLSELGKYMKQEFFNEHPTFDIYTKIQNYKATVFSCYSIGINIEENNIKSLNFKEQIEYYKKSSVYSTKNIGEIEKIVKLSTCSYLNNHTMPTDQRYYIIAKLEQVY